MDEDTDAGRCQGGPIVVEHAVDVGIRRQLRVKARGAEKIEGLDGLRQEAVPQIHRKIWGDGGQSCHKVVFERANGTFCGVAAVDGRWGQLHIDILVGHVGD